MPYADVAQSVEQHIRNVRVVCSIHIIGSKISKVYSQSTVSLFYWGHAVKKSRAVSPKAQGLPCQQTKPEPSL